MTDTFVILSSACSFLQAEAEAQRMGRLAAMSAEDSIAATRERLQQRGASASGAESILQVGRGLTGQVEGYN